MLKNTISIETKDKIVEIFTANGFECKNSDRGSRSPDDWKGLGFHRTKDNAWAVLSQAEHIVLRLNHYSGKIDGADWKVNGRTKGTAHKPFVDKFKNFPGIAVTCMNVETAKKVIEQYSMM